MKIDWQHVAMVFGAPALTAFVDYLVNSAAPFSKPVLQHAALSTLLVVVALAKQSFLTPKAPAMPSTPDAPTVH